LCVSVGLAAFWQRRIMPVSAFLHFSNLLTVPKIKLLNAVFKSQGFRVVSVSSIFALESADYAVQFCMLAK